MLRALIVLALLGRSASADVGELTKAAPACEATRATCVGLALHVAIEAGKPVATADWLLAQLAEANRHFAPLGVGYQVVSIDERSTARVKDRRERSALGVHVKGTVIHVFVTGRLDDVDIAGDYIYGVTWRRGATKYVILSTVAWPRTLAHELGHVFGLPHSSYAISIMNKTERSEPPHEQRTFATEEITAMKPRLQALLRGKAIVSIKPESVRSPR